MNVPEVIARIEKIETLPIIPPILKRILSVIEDPKVSLQKITDFVSSDPTLTARILKMVNSPVYGFPGRISSVSHAMVILGLNAVKGLLLGVSVFEIMQKSMIGLWEHSLSTAIFARIIAMKKELPSPEEISIGGLLHDIGKVIFIMAFKDEYISLIESVEEKENFLYEIEKQHFEITHAEIGGIIAKRWNLPLKLIEPIIYHHRPQLASQFQKETAVVHLSNTLAVARGVGYSGEVFVPSVHSSAWEVLNLKGDEISDILKEAEEPITASVEIFLSDE